MNENNSLKKNRAMFVVFLHLDGFAQQMSLACHHAHLFYGFAHAHIRIHL